MNSKLRCFLIVCVLSIWTGCDVPFSPKGEYREKLVVYTVLDPSRKVQFARVYRTYNVEGLDPRQNTADPQVRNALVKIFDETGHEFVFKDTVLKRDSSDRYSSDIFAYYNDRLIPAFGKRYTLEIAVPQYGKATASVTVPEPYNIQVNGSRVRDLLADSLNPCQCIEVALFGGSGAKGHLTRFFLNYTVKKRGQPEVNLRREVPLLVRQTVEGAGVLEYPKPDRIAFLEYSKELFFATLDDVLKSEPTAEIKAETVTFISHALEPNVYNYYLIAHGFASPISVRLDLPDFTNIQNGVGVFGAVAVDSVTLPIKSK